MRPEKLADQEYEEQPITEVRESGDSWEISADGTWLSIPKVEGVTPRVGSVARYYGRGFGYPVRGVDIDGQEVYYRTVEEQSEQHRQWVEEENAKKRAEAEAAKDETARRIAALPDVMQRRLQKFQDTNPDFDWEYLPYELMVCEDAVKIMLGVGKEFGLKLVSPDENDVAAAIHRFYEMSWTEQKRIVPNLDDGHSGNSFGMACRLARWLLTDPELVVKDHGALANLVGCEAYGCPHPVEESTIVAGADPGGCDGPQEK